MTTLQEKNKFLSFKERRSKSLSPELISQFQQLVEASSSILKALKQEALKTLLEVGIPFSKSEDYSSINTSFIESFYQLEVQPSSQKKEAKPSLAPLLPFTHNSIVIINGKYSKEHSQLIDPIHISLLEEHSSSDKLAQLACNNQKEQNDSVAALSVLCAANPLVIDFPEHVTLKYPVHLQFIHSSHQQSLQRADTHLIIQCGTHSQVDLIAQFSNDSLTHEVMNSTTIDFAIEAEAKLSWNAIIEEKKHVRHFFKAFVRLGKAASFYGNNLVNGQHFNRQSVEAHLEEEGSYAEWNCASLVNKKAQVHQHLLFLHKVPHCNSKQLFKNILKEDSRTSVDGTVIVNEGAHHTDAQQLINNLILSDSARATNKPNLMIFADDVKCAHGATIGQLDSEQIFYLQSRGMTKHQALALLMDSFLQSTFSEIEKAEIKDWFSQKIIQLLA